MFPAPLSPSRRPSGRAALVALLVLLCFAACLAPVAAAESTSAPICAAPSGMVVVGFFNDILGNRTRMIQIACVFVAIGVFILTRTYR